MNSKPLLPLPTDPFPDLGGEHRKRSPLRISETDQSVCPYAPSADDREMRYKSESNPARCVDHGIPKTLHAAGGLCKKVVEVRLQSKDR